MSDPILATPLQGELLQPDDEERNLLDQLLSESRLYRTTREYRELLDFTIRLRNMAPFNAMLLQVQKQGLSYAASQFDWTRRFNRTVKETARPLLIMWPFGPVALVYDILDTEGPDLPKDAFAFYAVGKIDAARMEAFSGLLEKKHILVESTDRGDNDAGLIRRMNVAKDAKQFSDYKIHLNRNHPPAVGFVTLAHELAHLYLGHLGDDRKLHIQGRQREHRMREIEAESVAYILSHRNGVETRSQKYLNGFVESGESADHLDLYAITRAAGHIERLLGLSRSSQWRDPKKSTSRQR